MINSSGLAELHSLFAPGAREAPRAKTPPDTSTQGAPSPTTAGKDVLEASAEGSSAPAKGTAGAAAASEAGGARAAGLDRRSVEANREDSRRKLGQARLKLASQVLGAGFLLATLVTCAVLCPPALVLVAPVCVFAGHALLGAFNKALAEKEAARVALLSADQHLSAPEADPQAATPPTALTRRDSAVSQSLSGFDGEDPSPSTPRAALAPNGLATPTAKGAASPSPTAYESIDQSCRAWLEAREVHQKSHEGLEAATLRLKAAGGDLRTHLAAWDAAQGAPARGA